MLIVEGPDGAGKTTLMKHLATAILWPVAERVVDKNTNAMVDLKKWTEENVAKGFQPLIFDRHRMISDPIYGPIMRPQSGRAEVYDIAWYASMAQMFWDADPWVIFCLPPLGTVVDNLEFDEDNDAVRGNIDRIYRGYVSLAAHLEALGKNVMTYDYTTEHPDVITRVIKALIRSRKDRRP